MQLKKDEQGLYVPQLEKDSCGVGLLADLKGIGSNQLVTSALTILENMKHRGASGYEENTGDGAGILTRIPHLFFKLLLSKEEISLPREGKYGVGMFFLPKNSDKRAYCMEVIQKWTERKDFNLFHIRQVPTDNQDLGQSAIDSEPNIVQLFFKTARFNNKDIERRFYYLRSAVMKEIYFADQSLTDDFYICSLSSQTIVYKGQLTATQLRAYYPDLTNSEYISPVAIVHSRFSTNTIPKWKLAQPFRCIAHNGEINTIQGNINWWNSREKYMEKIAKDRQDLSSIFPVCDPYSSDSGNFDNVVDFLLRASRSIPHSIMMMIPEAWQNDPEIEDYKKAFYEYHDALLEPWDGPASICFTDGTVVGATLDRNGLRPSRYLVTHDDLLVLGSEAGCLNIDPARIKTTGRLQPGKMLVADLDEHRIISDHELKETICNRKPYREWLKNHALHINQLEEIVIEPEADQLSLITRQLAAGMSLEDKKLILDSMSSQGKEPIGSMGADIPLAVLSKTAQHVGNYFKQQFAQVTNPPIDSLREKYFMSLSSVIGGGSKVIGTSAEESCTLRTDSPILSHQQYNNIRHSYRNRLEMGVIDISYSPALGLEKAILSAREQALTFIENDKRVLCLSDFNISKDNYSIPSLLIVGALHHFLIEKGLRKEVALLVRAGDIWETHHCACLLSFGADLVYPYLALNTVEDLAKENKQNSIEAMNKYIQALNKGLLKIMSKLGVSTLMSYKGAQTFEILGIGKEVVQLCFKGSISRIGGLSFEDLEKENSAKHKLAFKPTQNNLPDLGVFQWKKRGEYHLFNPTTIHLLQYSTRTNQYLVYKDFAEKIDQLEQNSSVLRSYLRIKAGKTSIPLEEVESKENILKRFATGAMSLGSLSHEAHSTLAIAMNRIGGKSNSGEGGEDKTRFNKKDNGDWERSAIKQVASGRFGVDIHYLTNAIELQIKMAQGAKPGEGGQLPGHKVNEYIGKIRNSTPGVGLISPPPHHDIYSIEDLAQLIYDLKNANPKARISVKLVSKAGVGVIASGVTKAHADHILISGFDGGTGASPLSSIRHAGLPWELGLAETHQTLVKNGLRDRVVIQTDGQIRTGRDLAIATMLGAEEWGIATAALVVEGCILMRKCHLNTCPVGIATQDKDLRAKFNGKVEHVVNYFNFLADHLREIMADVGIKTVNELVGRTDLLEIQKEGLHWKAQNLKLEKLLFQSYNKTKGSLYCSKKQDHGLDKILDRTLIKMASKSLENREVHQASLAIKSTDRATGTMLSHEIAKRYGAEGLPPNTITFKFKGSSGQSFGAFGAKGLTLSLEGEANDYFGKGLSGALLQVFPSQKATFEASQQTIIGNVALYGATSGQAYISGKAGDRFCVRNSGALAIVEGIGDNGCEYMTGGEVIILGEIGKNFGAGMSGGVAYVYKTSPHGLIGLNTEMVHIEQATEQELASVLSNIKNHVHFTNSSKGKYLIENWVHEKSKFLKIIAEEYQRALSKKAAVLTNQQ